MSLLVPRSRSGEVAAILAGFVLIIASVTTLTIVVTGDSPPPRRANLVFRYGGVLCSLRGCLLETVLELCRARDVEGLRMRVNAVSADDTRAAILVTYRAHPGVEKRLARIAAEPFRPLDVEPWTGPLPNWNADWCRLSTS